MAEYLGQPQKEISTTKIGSLADRLKGFGAGLAAMGGNMAPTQQIQAEQERLRNEMLRQQAAQEAKSYRDKQESRSERQLKLSESTADFNKQMKQKEMELKKIAMNQKKEGKPLSSAAILKINEGNAIPETLSRIGQLIQEKKNLFSPITGKARSINPYDTEAQVTDAEMRAASQQFGRFMEGGVLRKEDEEKYRRMFPKLGDTPSVAEGKLNVISSMMQRKQKSDIGALKQQGFNLAGLEREFQPLKPVMQNKNMIAQGIDTAAGALMPATAQAAEVQTNFAEMPTEQLYEIWKQQKGIK